MALEVLKLDFSTNFIKFSTNFIRKQIKIGYRVVFISPNKRPLRFIQQRLTPRILLKSELYTIREFIDKLCNDLFTNITRHTPLERDLFFLQLIKEAGLDEVFGEENHKLFIWAKRLSSLFNDFEKQMINHVENIQYQETVKEAETLLENLKFLFELYKKSYKNYTFEGKCLNDLVKTTKDKLPKQFSDKAFVFAGFGFMSNSEIEIVKNLSKNNKVTFIVQTDLLKRDIIDGKSLETFSIIETFLKNLGSKNTKTLKPYKNSVNSTLFEFYEFNSRHEEAAFIASKINKERKSTAIDPLNTAIILPEPETLFPLLSNLNDELHTNITLGYPFSFTSFGEFIRSLFVLLIDIQKRNFKKVHPKFLKKLINTPFFGYLNMDLDKTINTTISFSSLPLSLKSEELNQLKIYLIEPFIYSENLASIKSAFKSFYSLINKEKLKKNPIDLYCLETFYKDIVNRIPENRTIDVDMVLVYTIIQQEMENLFIPFEGHPLKGIQVLGILESRMLNFEKIFIPDTNEGILPKGDKIDPLLPEDIKQYLGLTTFSQREKLIRYNFFRTVYSSKKAFIIYKNSISSNEKYTRSRYIDQLLLLRRFSNFPQTYRANISFSAKNNTIHSEEFSKFLKNKLITGISPTELNELIRCPYAFYLKRVKELEGKATLQETLEANRIGNIMHAILEKNFGEEKGNIDEKKYIKIKNSTLKDCKNIKRLQYLHNNLKNDIDYINNLDEIKYEILITVVLFRIERFFNITLTKFEPFKIIAVEKELKSLFYPIFGTLDRIDLIGDSIIRVVDYKTGYHPLGYKSSKIEEILNKDHKNCCDFLKELSEIYNSLQMPIYRILAEEAYKKETIGEIYHLGSSNEKEIIEKFYDNLDIHKTLLEKLLSWLTNCSDVCAFPSRYCSFCEFNRFCVFSK